MSNFGFRKLAQKLRSSSVWCSTALDFSRVLNKSSADGIGAVGFLPAASKPLEFAQIHVVFGTSSGAAGVEARGRLVGFVGRPRAPRYLLPATP
jgi:hypothetical protein